MASMFGIDTSGPATKALETQAVPLIGGSPQFWGRYFNGTANKDYQYENSENTVLSQLGIPVLCFARQMWAVGNPSDAQAHASENMKGVVDAFGAQYLLNRNISPILYLDLEPESQHPEHLMDQKYYENWSAAIVAGFKVGGSTIRFHPAVYLNLGDSKQSWKNLNRACVGGAVCVGVSVAHYLYQDPKDEASLPVPFGTVVWNDAQLTPSEPIPPGQPNAHIPTLAWQWYGDYLRKRKPNGDIQYGDIDLQMVNPAYAALLRSGVVPPPSPGA